MADSIQKGRLARGTMRQDAKLTDELVTKIRSEYAADAVRFEDLAKKYGVSCTVVRLAVTGKTWNHVPGKVQARPRGSRFFCKRGHLLCDENCYKERRGSRQCKICTLARRREKKAEWLTKGTK